MHGPVFLRQAQQSRRRSQPSETDTGGPTQTSVCGNLFKHFGTNPNNGTRGTIDADFEKEHWDLDHADEVKLVENGPLRAHPPREKSFFRIPRSCATLR